MRSSEKTWVVREPIPKEKEHVYANFSPIVAQLLFNRGIENAQEAEMFLHPDYDRDLKDPFLFTTMKRIVDRIFHAVDTQEHVVVYGDYDADGVCSATILEDALRAYGMTHVSVYLPHREKEGYGLNMTAVSYLLQKSLNLLVTVDCGSTNVAEVEELKKRNVDVIVLDHHTEQEQKPDAFAILNPKFRDAGYPFRDFASAGVVYKVVQALVATRPLSPSWEKWFLDLVAIATVSDLMDLSGENRTLVKFGLLVLNKTRRKGLQELIRAMGKQGKQLGPYEVGFMIGPRLNAAGRMDHANAAYALLQEPDAGKAACLANRLNQTNYERQRLTTRIFEEADVQVQKKMDKRILVAVQPKENAVAWSAGIVGLVAGRITQKYHRPSLVIGRSDKGMVGSGRSLRFNLIEAIQACKGLFLNFGGHAQACGFTLKGEHVVDELEARLHDIASAQSSVEELVPELLVDKEFSLKDVHYDLWEDVSLFQPFGQGNREPVFLSQNVRVVECQVVGSDASHLKLVVEQGVVQKNAIGFAMADARALCAQGAFIDVAYSLHPNEWNRNMYLDLRIVDICKARREQKA